MTIVDQFAIVFGLDTKDMPKQMAELSNKLSSGVASIAKNLAGPLATVFSFAAAGQMFKEIASEADALGKAADRLGVSIEDLDAWGQAAKLSGGSAEALSSTVEGLSKNLTNLAITGTSSAKPFLEQLGVSATGTGGKVRDAFEVLEEIAGKIEGMDKNKSAGILQGIGIDKGTITLIQSGKKSIQELIKEQKEIGVYNKKTAETMEKYNDSMDNLVRTVKMSLVPVATFLAEKFTKGAKLAADGMKYLREHATVLAPAAAALAVVLMTSLVPAIWAAVSPLLPFIALFATLGLLFEDLIVWAEGGESALGDLWASLFGSPEEAMALFTELGETLEWLGNLFVNQVIPVIIEIMGNFVKIIGEGIGIAIDRFKALYNHVMFVIKVFEALWEALFGTSDAADKALGEAMGYFEKFQKSVLSVIDRVKSAWENFKGIFSGVGKIINIGADGAKIAAQGGANFDNSRQIDQTMTQTVNIKMNNADPNAVGQAVAGQTQTTFKNLTLAADGGQQGL